MNKTKLIYEQLGTYEKVSIRYCEVTNKSVSINTIKSWVKGLSKPSEDNQINIDTLFDEVTNENIQS